MSVLIPAALDEDTQQCLNHSNTVVTELRNFQHCGHEGYAFILTENWKKKLVADKATKKRAHFAITAKLLKNNPFT